VETIFLRGQHPREGLEAMRHPISFSAWALAAARTGTAWDLLMLASGIG